MSESHPDSADGASLLICEESCSDTSARSVLRCPFGPLLRLSGTIFLPPGDPVRKSAQRACIPLLGIAPAYRGSKSCGFLAFRPFPFLVDKDHERKLCFQRSYTGPRKPSHNTGSASMKSTFARIVVSVAITGAGIAGCSKDNGPVSPSSSPQVSLAATFSKSLAGTALMKSFGTFAVDSLRIDSAIVVLQRIKFESHIDTVSVDSTGANRR